MSDLSTHNAGARTEATKATSDVAGVVSFETGSGASTVVSSPPNVVPVPRPLINSGTAGVTRDIQMFLAQPYPLRTGSFSVASLYQMAAFDPFYEMCTGLNLKAKLSGFMGFQATTVCRLVVNANRFCQGRLLMSFVPQGHLAKSYPLMRTHTKMLLSQLPHVQFDIGCDTQAILRIPYVSYAQFFDFINWDGQPGVVYLHKYADYLTGVGGATDAKYTIFVHFEDVKLAAPSAGSAFWAHGPRYIKKKNTSTKEDTTDCELEASNIGPVTKVMGRINEVALSLTQVPFLSDIAAPVAWCSNALKQTAAWFGWSNPLIESPAERRETSVLSYINNCDAADNAFKLALKSTNKIEMLPGFAGSDIDEMNILSIVTTPALYVLATWASTSDYDHKLQTFHLYPYYYSYQLTDTAPTTDVTYQIFTPLAYISQFFEYYRGSIKFTFKFVKTEFHTGRINLSFVPTSTDTTVTIVESNLAPTEIIDLRDGNEFTFIVPYVSNTPWRNRTSSYGSLHMRVLDPLRAPETCSQAIDYILEVSAHTDMEFAVPSGPYNAAATTANSPYVSFANIAPFVAQMDVGTKSSNVCDVSPPKIMSNLSVTGDTLDAAKYCIGETVTSILQLLKRTTYIGRNNFFATATSSIAFTLNPWTIGTTLGPTALTTAQSGFVGDYYDLLVPLFAFYRGSVRIRAIPTAPDARMSDATRLTISSSYTAGTEYKTGFYSLYPRIWTDFAVNAATSVEMPYYARTHCIPTQFVYDDTANLASYENYASLALHWTDATTMTVGRQVGDDFSLGMFIGVPPMYNFAV